MTTNRELYLNDPGVAELLNNGVAEVTDSQTDSAFRTLRYELQSFVCEGQYAKGLERILNSFLNNLDKPEQPAVWVSGFYGSGKSHLVKMLRYLWADLEFADRSTARGLATVPPTISDALKELSTQGKRSGGLHAAAGKLGAGAGDSVRLALLGIVFRSAGLPEEYPKARFVMWLRETGLHDAVRAHVEKKGKSFDKELDHLYVSPHIAEALLAADPRFAASPGDAKALLAKQYAFDEDITTTQMEEAINDALSKDGRFPCTLIVLDEVQQYIGDDSRRAHMIQEVTEACSKRFAGKLLFVGTGQTALTGTPQLQKLKDRFRIPVELSDSDVETVIRRIVLAKRPDRTAEIEKVLSACSGEISRHLVGTRIEPRSEDRDDLVPDYPLLPVRRRFWERVLRAVDTAGTAGQLRTQLKIVHEAVRANADERLGNVIAGDALYDQNKTDLLQTGVLLREIYELIERLRDNTPDGILRSRLCSLVFLIGKLPRQVGLDEGIRATVDTLGDLVVTDVNTSSTELRRRIPELLEGLLEEGRLMQVDGEYRLQTRESAAWDGEFRRHQAKFANDDAWVASHRADVLRGECGERLRGVRVLHGKSKVPRKIDQTFGSTAPKPTGGAVPVWIRNEWDEDEKSVLADARAAGADSPVVHVFIPRRSADELKAALAAIHAAEQTLNERGKPTTSEGIEAGKSIEGRHEVAKTSLSTVLADIFGGTKVFLGGGSEKTGMTLDTTVQDAAQDALARMFPEFDTGDDPRWVTVKDRVRKGDGDALDALGYKGNVEQHPVCAAILTFVGAGQKGREVRKHFENPPYGWPQDTIDGALLALVASGHIRAVHSGNPVDARQLDQTKIGVADFRVETATISTTQRIALRKLFQDAGITCKPNDEPNAAIKFLDEMKRRADAAGGDAPLPARPRKTHLEDIGKLAGNEQLAALCKQAGQLSKEAAAWRKAAEAIEKRLPRWKAVNQLAKHAAALPVAQSVALQVAAIETNRALLTEPDPVPPLADQFAKALRESVVKAHGECKQVFDSNMKALLENDVWKKLAPAQRQGILDECGIRPLEDIRVGTEAELLAALDKRPLDQWATLRDALAQRFANALTKAAKLLEPKALRVDLPTGTLRTQEDVEKWLSAARDRIMTQLKDGPVIV